MRMDISKLKDEEIDELLSFLDRKNIRSFIRKTGSRMELVCSSTPIKSRVELEIENIA